MKGLNKREKVLLWGCFITVFAVFNFFAIKWAMGALSGGGSKIKDLKYQLGDAELVLLDAETWAIKNQWLGDSMPTLTANALGKAQGDLLQQLQDDAFQRKLKVDRQSLQEPKTEPDYTEVSVRFEVRGDLEKVVEWLSTLQSPEKFVVIKYLELELDNRARDATEPQAKCEITIARWFRSEESDLPESTNPPAAPKTETDTGEKPPETPATETTETPSEEPPKAEPTGETKTAEISKEPASEVAKNEATGSE